MRNFWSCLFIVVLSIQCIAQTPIDSLSKQLAIPDLSTSEYLKIITLLTKEYAETNPDTALVISNSALRMARENRLDSATGQIFIATSTAWSFLAQYDSSMKYSFLALRKSEQYSDTVTLIDAYNNIGIDHMFRENDEKAVEYFTKVSQLSNAFGDTLRWGHALNNLGLMEGYLGNSQEELNYYEKAAVLFDAIEEEEGFANTLLNIGTVYTVLGEYAKAESYYEDALNLFRLLDYSSGIQNTIQSWAENALENNELEKARKLANEALSVAIDHSLSQDILYTYDLLEKISLGEKDYKSAYDFEIKEAEIREELFTKEKSKQISELETQYETEKKEAEITRLSLENDLKDSKMIAGGISGGLVIILLIVFFTLRHKKQKAEKEAQELQIEAMKKRFMELHSSPAELAVDLDFVELNNKLHTPLTEREFDALKLSIEGKTNTEIGEKLFISVSTVKFHLRNTYSKMGVGNRKEAFQYMLKTS